MMKEKRAEKNRGGNGQSSKERGRVNEKGVALRTKKGGGIGRVESTGGACRLIYINLMFLLF